MGPPGSGKGTQAARLTEVLGGAHVASGDLFRDNLNRNTALGMKAREYMNRGELVPDEVTIAMLKQRLQQPDVRKGMILDGFPRTLPQAEALAAMLASLKMRLNAVLYIQVGDDEIVRRLSGRLICRECQTPFHKTLNPFRQCPMDRCNGEYLYQREDDKPETVKARLQTYRAQTAPLVDFYRDAGLLIAVSGEGSVEQITETSLEAIRANQKTRS